MSSLPISDIMQQLPVLLTPTMLFYLAVGVLSGLLMGSLPGFGAAQALALMLPLTYRMDALPAILFLVSIYHAAEYGGSIPAILVRTPGAPSSAVTVIEGYAMARRGLARKALRISLFGGVFGSLVSTIIFIFAAPSLAWIGLQFGPSEMFAIGVFGLGISSSLFGKSALKGLLAAGIGLWLGTVGSSDFSGMRYTFDQAFLYSGINVLIVIIGFLAVPEVLSVFINSLRQKKTGSDTDSAITFGDPAKDKLTFADVRRLLPSFLRGSVLGTLVGTLPGAGATVASIISYNEERRWSKTPERWGGGEGVEEGVAGPETAINAVVSGALVPTLALGIPGSASSAILLGMMVSKGVVPGPLLFQNNMTFVVLVFLGMLVCALLLLVLGLLVTRPFSLITRVKDVYLGPFIFLLLIIGAYSYQVQAADIGMVLFFGVVGYLLKKVGVPLVPIVLANVMQPIIEDNLDRALTISNGDLGVLFSRPLTALILTLAVSSAVLGFIRDRRRARHSFKPA